MQLFLSLLAPHNLVSSSTIARWIKQTLQAGGVDVSTYTTAAKCLKVVVLLFKNDLNRDRVVGKLSELEHFFIDCATFNI